MNNIKFYIYVWLIATLCGCTDKEIIKVNENLQVTASIQSSRTAYSSENGLTHVSWVEGDAIGLFSKDFVNYKYSALNSGTEAAFQGTLFKANEGDTIYAFYPYDEMIDDNYPYLQDILLGKLPLPDSGSQKNEDGISRYDYMYAMGIVKNNQINFQFKHLFAVLQITLPVSMLNNYKLICINSTEHLSADSRHPNLAQAMFDPIDGTIIDSCYKLPWDDKDYNCLMNSLECVLTEEDLQEEELTITLGILPQSKAAIIEIQTKHYDGETWLWETIYEGGIAKDGMEAGCLYKLNLNEERFASRKEKDLKALKAFYESTNGDEWKDHTNWFSDEPLYNWYGLSNGEVLLSEYANTLNLYNNNLRGTLPEEFAYLMSNIKNIDLCSNGLYGKIPQSVLEHPRWSEIGWNVIQQAHWLGGGFDYSGGINLKTEDAVVSLFVENKQTSVYDILSKNELTYVFNAGSDDFIFGISDQRVNLYLDYCNKGFGIVATASPWPSYDNYIAFIKEQQANGLPQGILWAENEFGNAVLSYSGAMHLFDKEGNLVSYWFPGESDESWYNEQLDSILHARLGEPEEHPLYVTKYYTSSDYSKDGEVLTLQKATVGKGVDLVFMGDAYVDLDMNDGGKYEEHMRKSMEYFFGIEPYKSFRDRFNVYTVKVVSPNESSRGEHRINFNDGVCFEYAGKIPGVDLDKVTIVNVTNSPNPFMLSGFTNMYESGASVAHIEQGGPSHIIVHESGGHGFAKLIDEYIYSGYENNYFPPENVPAFKEAIYKTYHSIGWGVNVDATNDPDSIIWSHFLKDERYKDEIGIYQGAWYWPFNLWRPSENSVMNRDYSWFNAPSREAIYKRIMELSEGEGWTYNYEDFVEYDAINRNANTESRSVSTSSQDRRRIHKDHRPPTYIKGSWRDAMKNGNRNVVIPLRW